MQLFRDTRQSSNQVISLPPLASTIIRINLFALAVDDGWIDWLSRPLVYSLIAAFTCILMISSSRHALLLFDGLYLRAKRWVSSSPRPNLLSALAWRVRLIISPFVWIPADGRTKVKTKKLQKIRKSFYRQQTPPLKVPRNDYTKVKKK